MCLLVYIRSVRVLCIYIYIYVMGMCIHMDALCFFSCIRSTINDSLTMHSRAKRVKGRSHARLCAVHITEQKSELFFISQYFGTRNIGVI